MLLNSSEIRLGSIEWKEFSNKFMQRRKFYSRYVPGTRRYVVLRRRDSPGRESHLTRTTPLRFQPLIFHSKIVLQAQGSYGRSTPKFPAMKFISARVSTLDDARVAKLDYKIITRWDHCWMLQFSFLYGQKSFWSFK